MNLIESFSGIGDGIKNFFQDFVDMISTASEALKTFYELLDEFDTRIVAMVDDCGATEFDGLPVVKAIATYHYVVGDVVFYLMYIIILFGCLWTIFKLIMLAYQAFKMLISNASDSVMSSSQLSVLLSKLFKI